MDERQPERAGTGITGHYLVLFQEGRIEAGSRLLQQATGLKFAAARPDQADTKAPRGAGAVVFERLGVAVVTAPPPQFHALVDHPQAWSGAGRDKPILAIEPERIAHALGRPEKVYADDDQAAWGLQAIGVLKSKFSGRGVKVAVLDTGMDFAHPDFAGREMVSKSFVKRQDVQDKIGHGTHCVGTACGPRQPVRPKFLRRYGVAGDASIYVGKVLGNNGFGDDGGILTGMEWAMANGCRVISMSLGAEVAPGTPPSQVFETVARRALAAGTLIVAAAGNESDRENGKRATGSFGTENRVKGLKACTERKEATLWRANYVSCVGSGHAFSK